MNGHEIPKDIMAEAEVECVDCHLREDDKIFRSNKGKCIDCHDEDYADMFDEWQNSAKDLISSIDSSIREMKNIKLDTEGKRTLFEIEKILQKIKFDGSSGVHNYMFFDEVLTDLEKKMGSIGKATK